MLAVARDRSACAVRPAEPRPTAEVLPLRRRADKDAVPAKAPCFSCPLRHLCLPAAVGDLALHDLDGGLIVQRRVRRGHVLYREGDRFQQLYAVRFGTFKLAAAVEPGRNQVSRIAVPGDLLGLDGIARGVCTGTATALEDSQVCSLSFATLRDLALRRAQWQESLCRVMAEEVVREHRHILVLGSYRTDARLAAFLLEVSDRLYQRGYSRSEFHLRLSRAEIGSYLGLTLETISRTLSAFQKNGWIHVRHRHVRILSREKLERVARRRRAARRPGSGPARPDPA